MRTIIIYYYILLKLKLIIWENLLYVTSILRVIYHRILSLSTDDSSVYNASVAMLCRGDGGRQSNRNHYRRWYVCVKCESESVRGWREEDASNAFIRWRDAFVMRLWCIIKRASIILVACIVACSAKGIMFWECMKGENLPSSPPPR